MTKEILTINNLSKQFILNNNKLPILTKVNFKILEGDIVSISGPSGSGKSTFLNILGLLDSDFSGEYIFLQENIKKLSLYKKNKIRNESVGFVHQFFHLIPELTVIENVALPNLINNNIYSDSIKLAKDILVNFGLKDKINIKPINLSGGEKQRVAIARSLINKPNIILADEMTGNLDEKTANSVFDFFLDKIKLNKQSLIYVTHNKNYAMKAKYKYKITNEMIIRI
jgi:lipoprotein-releasing system ATP-binding protein